MTNTGKNNICQQYININRLTHYSPFFPLCLICPGNASTLRSAFCSAQASLGAPFLLHPLMSCSVSTYSGAFHLSHSLSYFPSPSNHLVIPSRGYRKLSHRNQPHPKGNASKPHKTTLLHIIQPNSTQSKTRPCHHHTFASSSATLQMN